MGRATVLVALLVGCGPAERPVLDAGEHAVDASAPDAGPDILGLTEIIELDQASGEGTVVQSGGPAWLGAAVTTSAPVL